MEIAPKWISESERYQRLEIKNKNNNKKARFRDFLERERFDLIEKNMKETDKTYYITAYKGEAKEAEQLCF